MPRPPLYKIKCREDFEYAYSDRERDALIELALAGRQAHQGRLGPALEGLGEMNDAE
ncbi:hypothetical protein [Streptomyces sp. KL116D]|uniref:hypothetical protein n=1 Tax=Streptomyces sp. KL116D TaxID=3045152 RepID=UPI0035581D39